MSAMRASVRTSSKRRNYLFQAHNFLVPFLRVWRLQHESGLAMELEQQLKKVKLVRERMALAKWVFESSEQRLAKRDIVAEGGGWNHPHEQNDSLVNYLLLTCFDLLGQEGKWYDFGAWLQAGACKDDVTSTIEKKCNVSSVLEATRTLHQYWQDQYGVRRSFYRFIDEVLNDASRRSLTQSVQITHNDRTGNASIVVDDRKKRQFLFECRNLFTHGGIPTGSAFRVLSPMTVIIEDGVVKWGYLMVRKDKKYTYHVRRWPFLLFEVVAREIGDSVPEFSVPIDAWVTNNRGVGVVISGVRYSDLRDVDGLVRLASR